MTPERTAFDTEQAFRASLERRYLDVTRGRRSTDDFETWLAAVEIAGKPLTEDRRECFCAALALMLHAYRAEVRT